MVIEYDPTQLTRFDLILPESGARGAASRYRESDTRVYKSRRDIERYNAQLASVDYWKFMKKLHTNVPGSGDMKDINADTGRFMNITEHFLDEHGVPMKYVGEVDREGLWSGKGALYR